MGKVQARWLLSAFVPSRLIPVCLLAAALFGCSSGGPAGPPDDCRTVGTKVTVVAANLGFDIDCLLVKRGSSVTITLDNRDRSVQHDLIIDGPSGRFGTGLITGPAAATFVFVAAKQGPHPFDCTPHSQTMNGTIWVEG